MGKWKNVVLSVLGLLAGTCAFGQNTYVPMGSPEYAILDRHIILTQDPLPLHTAIKPFRRADAARLAARYLETAQSHIGTSSLIHILQSNNEFTSINTDPGDQATDIKRYVDSSQTFYIAVDPVAGQNQFQSKRSFLKVFYTSPAHFFEINNESFYLRVNPMLHFGVGKEQGDGDPLFINKRGIEIRGGIDKRVFFATDIVETQMRPATHIRRWINEYHAVPDAGLFKSYRSSLFDFDGAYDYLNSSGYLGFNISEHVGVHLGHGKNFIGDGYRSLLLSDFAKNYFYLKLNTRVWKFHYQNIFAELSAGERESNIAVFPKKYLAAHYLSFHPTTNLSIGLYEAVVFARENGTFELQYLNPVILYRTIEQHVGSPDNVLIGFNARWDLFQTASLYGQIMLDEFKVSELFSSNNWWGNKYGIQLGVKYINAFNVNQLDLQIEYNRVRPFTYTHRDSIGSYAHFNQPLAHPSGANFTEFIAIASYKPFPKLELTAKLFLVEAAEDTDEVFYGTNILRPNGTRNGDYGIEQGQGIGVDNVMFTLDIRYMLKHNLVIEAEYFRRDYKAQIATSDLLTQYVSIGLRWNLFNRLTEY